MPKIICEKISTWKIAPRKKADPAKSGRIRYCSTTNISGDQFQSIKELYIPPYAYEDFTKNPQIHYIQTFKPPQQFRIAIGGIMLKKEDMPPITKYGWFRLKLYWLCQTLLGNV